ncbi:MAG: hypothetical protein PHG04_03335 [Candidatus Nanoarchaeia archaeon]|nr:hypothetical protein [Candidatus Nanoarchaeia archaeon]
MNAKDIAGNLYVASLFKYGEVFSVIPRFEPLKNNRNGVYLDNASKTVCAVFDKKYSIINIKDAGEEKVVQNALWENKEFFTAVLCMFHPKYASIETENNLLSILLENEHEFFHLGKLPGFFVNTCNEKIIPKKEKNGILKYFS